MKYIYCIISNENSITPNLKGINDKNIKLYSYHDIAIIYSDVTDFTIENNTTGNALKHLNVIDTLIKYCPVIPFRFGVVCNGSTGLNNIASIKYSEIKNELSRLTGMVEYGLRIGTHGENMKPVNGKEYLKRQIHYHKKRSAMGMELNAFLSDIIVESKIDRSGQKINEANYLFLISKKDEAHFTKRIEELKLTEKHYLTGPWAPYNFCNLKLEHV